MSYTVQDQRIEGGYTFADVSDDAGEHVGRIVRADPSGTWGPDQALQEALGHGGRWPSYEDARKEIEE